ncbi:hypothetical protein J2777_005935 [Paraburkholderia graminis]|nr:hypothetical protein [Paraburkholderia graminis]
MTGLANNERSDPPKLMPLFQRTAVNGTFPTEQLDDAPAISGPTKARETVATVG